MEFKPFAQAVAKQFELMSQHELYTVDLPGDDLYALYLGAFPEGTNPMFRERTEHDCSCCKNFIRNIGNVVAIINGVVTTVWDTAFKDQNVNESYRVVAKELMKAVTMANITGIYRTSEPKYGAESNKELRDGVVRTWNHFHGQIGSKHFTKTPDQVKGEFNANLQVFRRGVTELTSEAFQTVLELIEQKALYRGEEHLSAINKFVVHIRKYNGFTSDKDKEIYLMQNANDPATRFRNTVIGSLIVDLSNGVDLEAAVKSFEQKVAPTNYKRTTALVTESMVKDAVKTIKELKLEGALKRRMANIGDVSMNNVLWADNSVKPMMKSGIEGVLDSLATPKVQTIDPKKAEEISVEEFIKTVLPKADSIDLLVRNTQQGNFVTVTAPDEDDTVRLFKWDNNFAWAYDGNITDAIKERVKREGGKVEGDLMCRLAWDYRDDLDFHMQEPGGGAVAFYQRNSLNGGHLDVDANGGNGMMAEPVENIVYADRNKMRSGTYTLQVNNYTKRDPNAKGFTVQVEFDGTTYQFEYDKPVRQGETITVAEITYSLRDGFKIHPKLNGNVGAAKSNVKWGVPTETPVKVNTIMYSPNYWDENAVGNKHVFFMLNGCHNDEPVRGIFNEYLRNDLEKHRKVFEILGNRTKCEPTQDQLSGVGFSSTKNDTVLVNVTSGKVRKSYNIKF